MKQNYLFQFVHYGLKSVNDDLFEEKKIASI